MFFSLKDGRGKAEVADRRLRPDEATHPLEVGDGGHGGQAGQRDAVQVVAAARRARTSQSPTLRFARRTVQLSRIALSSKANGR